MKATLKFIKEQTYERGNVDLRGAGITLCPKCGKHAENPWGPSKLCDRCAIDLLFASGRSGRKRVISYDAD